MIRLNREISEILKKSTVEGPSKHTSDGLQRDLYGKIEVDRQFLCLFAK